MRVSEISFTSVTLLLALLIASVPLEGSITSGVISLEEWVAKYITADEKLICKRDVDGEYFFVSQIGLKVKVGSRIDVTGLDRVPKTLIVGWMFLNEKDGYLATNTLPTTVKEGYEKDGNRRYAEHIEYQTLNLQGSTKIHVVIDIKKCPTENCSREKTANKEEEQYQIQLCEIPLR